MGFSSVRPSKVLHLLGLLGFYICWDFLRFASLRTWAIHLLGLFLGFASVRTFWAFRLRGLLGFLHLLGLLELLHLLGLLGFSHL
jgi:hypothetical protein